MGGYLRNNIKKCVDCHRELPLDKFFLSSKSSDGYSGACKECYMYYRLNNSRKNKDMIKKEDAAMFIQDLVSSGELFECKTCHKKFLADNFYTKRDYGKVYLATNRCKRCEKFYQIERKFGISEEYYFSMLEKQGFKCEICKIPLEDYKNQGYRDFFSVDHDHKTGKIRGLLCDKCNRALGFFGENEETLLNAAEYIRKYKI